MPQAAPRARLAVLIDAENVPARIADLVFADIAELGEPIVRRAYGDFTQPGLAAWVELCPRLGILPQQQFIRSSGKNAADIALVIDAMDLLHAGDVTGFCLVSSDADFTRLALRMRERGVAVFGFGEPKAPESFRQACHRFTVFWGEVTPLPAVPPKVTTPPAAIVTLLRTAIRQLPHENGWVCGGRLGQHLLKLKPDFKPTRYGHATLRKLVDTAGAFETTVNNRVLKVRARP